MCTLVVCRAKRAAYPLCVAASRDEDPERSAAPPGLHYVGSVRAVFPRDRRDGGSWVGCNEHGIVAAITNFTDPNPGESHEVLSRGLVLTAALGEASIMGAEGVVRRLVETHSVRGFGLYLGDRDEGIWVHGGGARDYETRAASGDLEVLGNDREPGSTEIRGLAEWWAEASAPEAFDIEAILDRLVVVLATGRARATSVSSDPPRRAIDADGTWPVCIQSGVPRTTHATWIAVPRGDHPWHIRHAHGNPCVVAPRDYSWLAARMVAGDSEL
ncbi:MAG: NRDE family protein [Planctomycetes bacterium]|nr:NRDE family protein [Planctomycetota bacterium]